MKKSSSLPETTMKSARFDVFKFGMRGMDRASREDAEVARLVSLGARKPKNKGYGYKELKVGCRYPLPKFGAEHSPMKCYIPPGNAEQRTRGGKAQEGGRANLGSSDSGAQEVDFGVGGVGQIEELTVVDEEVQARIGRYPIQDRFL